MQGGGAKHSLSHWVKEADDDDDEYDEDDDKDDDDIHDNADGDYAHNWKNCSFSLHILNDTSLQSNMNETIYLLSHSMRHAGTQTPRYALSRGARAGNKFLLKTHQKQ